MESLERARDRQNRRYRADIFEPTIANTLEDIKYIVRQFDPAINRENQDIEVSTALQVNQNGQSANYKVSVPSRSKSKREIIIEGIDLIKKLQQANEESIKQTEEIEINGRQVKPIIFRPAEESSSWVDPLIKQWTGGHRHGTKIRWELEDGTYQYDPYEHKLTRILDEG